MASPSSGRSPAPRPSRGRRRGADDDSRADIRSLSTAPPALVWRWSAALLGLLAALPAAVVILIGDPAHGLALAAGVLPGAAIGVPAARRSRVSIAILGVLVGVCVTIGAFLAIWPPAAVAGIFVLAVGAAQLAARIPFGRIVLMLCLPMVGIGFSFDGVASGAALGGLMALGSIYVWLLALAWPVRPTGTGPPPAPIDSGSLDYGIRLGLAAAVAAGIGFALDLGHVGWACAACLLVMRPVADMTRSRGRDRVLDIVAGSLVAIGIVLYLPEPWMLAATVLVAVTAMAATRLSRRYLTPAFTTCIVFLLLLYGSPQEAEHRFFERLLETVLGVALALLFGVAVPWLRVRLAHRKPGEK